MAPFLVDAVRNSVAPTPAIEPSREARLAQLDVEQHLVQMQKDPLYWTCRDGASDRARLFRDTCFAEHVVDFSLDPDGGEVQLITHGNAIFTDAAGARQTGSRPLSPAQVERVR